MKPGFWYWALVVLTVGNLALALVDLSLQPSTVTVSKPDTLAPPYVWPSDSWYFTTLNVDLGNLGVNPDCLGRISATMDAVYQRLRAQKPVTSIVWKTEAGWHQFTVTAEHKAKTGEVQSLFYWTGEIEVKEHRGNQVRLEPLVDPAAVSSICNR